MEWSTTKQTRDGRRVMIFTEECPMKFSVIGFVEGETSADDWMTNGSWEGTDDSRWDLVDIPQTKFINVYEPNRIGSSMLASVIICETRARADAMQGENRIACLEFKSGDGL